MAVLTYTFAQLKAAAGHAVAKLDASGTGQFDAGNSGAIVVNNALAYLCNYAPWEWRTAYATLTTVNAQNYVDLPADFGELVDLWGIASPYDTKRFKRVTHQQMLRIRQQATAIAANAVAKTNLFYALSGKAQASVTAARLYRLQLHPVPTAVSNAFNLVYLQTLPTLSADTDVADIPAEFQAILMDLVRGYAGSSESPAAAESNPRWARAMELLEMHKALNARLIGQGEPTLDNVVSDYFDTGKVDGTWTGFS